MNRKNLTAAVLAGLAGAAGIVGSAQAVNINPDGLGQVLIYPYYTTNNDNATLLSVVNTSGDAKAVKVRFTEGRNTREVLDFNLYMSPYDVWTAAVYKNADGVPSLLTMDTTCTVPYLYEIGEQEFLPYALTDTAVEVKDLTAEEANARMSEGHFEMIEMGTLTDVDNGSATAATHVVDADTGAVAPADCGQLVDAWTDPDDKKAGDEGYWLLTSPFGLDDISAPTGGLFGGASIVNVEKAWAASYDAIAINGFADTVRANDFLHQYPGSVLPSLNSGNIYNGVVFLDDGSVQDSGALARPVDAVSYVFMHDQIMNEYTTEASIGGQTEWVVTFPTKHFYVYAPSAGGTVPVAPFTSVWDATEDSPTACEIVNLDTIWDREEQTIVPEYDPGEEIPPIVSPRPPEDIVNPDPVIPFELCYETSVIRFGDVDEASGASPMLGSINFHNIDNTALGFENGWARLQMDDFPYDQDGSGTVDCDDGVGDECYSRASLGGLNGLPVTGFAVQTFENGFLGEGGNTIGNYGGIYSHKATKKPGSDAGTFPPVEAEPQ